MATISKYTKEELLALEEELTMEDMEWYYNEFGLCFIWGDGHLIDAFVTA